MSHAFAAPGTFTVTIGARDALGNAAAAVTRQIAVSNAKGAPPPPPPGSGAPTTIASAKLKATWKASHLVGSVSVSGTVGANATLTLSIRRHGGKKTAAKSTFKVKAGKWTRSVSLPPSLAPGLYDVFVTGNGVKTSQRSFTIAAPKTGIVKRTYATGPRRRTRGHDAQRHQRAVGALHLRDPAEEGPDDHDPVDPPERQQARGQHAPAHDPRRGAGQGSLGQAAAHRTLALRDQRRGRRRCDAERSTQVAVDALARSLPAG